MPKTLQIRNVPDDLHRKLKVRAAELDMALSDYLISEFRRAVENPTLQEILSQLDQEEPITPDEDPATIIRRHRDAE